VDVGQNALQRAAGVTGGHRSRKGHARVAEKRISWKISMAILEIVPSFSASFQLLFGGLFLPSLLTSVSAVLVLLYSK